ncbi:hypothetical protein GCM10010329_02960 [Streptomyces spiroverticillatus]|nr:hypothetical protein [Streptomyces finlayi]GGZ86522.1 hypothetical protein GCM10010329_02960 [Streptomyces spiroverticillatus]
MALSARLVRRIARDFPEPGSAAEAERLLDGVPDGTERVGAAVVLYARGSVPRLRCAIELARSDWRDVLAGAGLADEDWPSRLVAELGTEPPRSPGAAGPARPE